MAGHLSRLAAFRTGPESWEPRRARYAKGEMTTFVILDGLAAAATP